MPYTFLKEINNFTVFLKFLSSTNNIIVICSVFFFSNVNKVLLTSIKCIHRICSRYYNKMLKQN